MKGTAVAKLTLNWLLFSLVIQAHMAPRKRTTRQRKNDPKSAKLEAFLQDFDSEGEFTLPTVKEHCSFLSVYTL